MIDGKDNAGSYADSLRVSINEEDCSSEHTKTLRTSLMSTNCPRTWEIKCDEIQWNKVDNVVDTHGKTHKMKYKIIEQMMFIYLHVYLYICT